MDPDNKPYRLIVPINNRRHLLRHRDMFDGRESWLIVETFKHLIYVVVTLACTRSGDKANLSYSDSLQ